MDKRKTHKRKNKPPTRRYLTTTNMVAGGVTALLAGAALLFMASKPTAGARVDEAVREGSGAAAAPEGAHMDMGAEEAGPSRGSETKRLAEERAAAAAEAVGAEEKRAAAEADSPVPSPGSPGPPPTVAPLGVTLEPHKDETLEVEELRRTWAEAREGMRKRERKAGKTPVAPPREGRGKGVLTEEEQVEWDKLHEQAKRVFEDWKLTRPDAKAEILADEVIQSRREREKDRKDIKALIKELFTEYKAEEMDPDSAYKKATGEAKRRWVAVGGGPEAVEEAKRRWVAAIKKEPKVAVGAAPSEEDHEAIKAQIEALHAEHEAEGMENPEFWKAAFLEAHMRLD